MNFLDANIHKDREFMQSLSKKLLHINNVNESKGFVESNKPMFVRNTAKSFNNADIRYQSVYRNDSISNINFRNALLIFAENKEIKKALKIYINEILVTNLKTKKYPVYPVVNPTLVKEEQLELVSAMQNYLDDIFYPKLWRWLGFHEKDGLKELIKEYMICGKLAFEIVYDNIKRPKDIVNIYPIDASCIQRFRSDYQTWYVYRDSINNTKERILHESQIVLIEYNQYDFGYISMVDSVRRTFNIMRGMQTAKVGWFASKSQVRIHIKLGLGDLSRNKAEQVLYEETSKLMTTYEFDEENGVMYFNGEKDSLSYQEYITAETASSGSPEIEEIVGTGIDLSETDSLSFWQKQYWSDWEIPYDRVDPSSVESWGFGEPSQLKKSEINFSKNCLDIKETLGELFKKIIITQLTLKEVEIGIDLSLLDSIEINWVSFNEYELPAELEMLAKRIEVANQISDFGKAEDVNGNERKLIPTQWIIENYLSDVFTPEQTLALDKYSRIADRKLGFLDEEGDTIIMDEGDENLPNSNDGTASKNVIKRDEDMDDDDDENIADYEDLEFI